MLAAWESNQQELSALSSCTWRSAVSGVQQSRGGGQSEERWHSW